MHRQRRAKIVATAVYDDADSAMLSAESASGQYPCEAVEMMDKIIRATEGHKLYRSLIDATRPDVEHSPPHAVAAAAADLATAIGASVILGFSRPGKPTDNRALRNSFGIHRVLQRQVPGGVPERSLVHEP